MKAVVFAAGIGTRLKPFTDFHPKALATVRGIPLLGHVMLKLAAAGAEGIVVNVHHFPQQIRDYIASSDFGVPIEISDETGLLLDTAGGLAYIARNSHLLSCMASDDAVAVHNADILTDFPLQEMIARHIRSNADATVLVDACRPSTRVLLFDCDGRMRGWHNNTSGLTKPQGLTEEGLEKAAFGGVHIMKRSFLDRISADAGPVIRPYSITDYYIGHCGEAMIQRYTPPAPYRWHDIGTPEKLEAACNDYQLTM